MSLLALIFALLCERGLTQLLRLRELRWLDPLFDRTDRALGGRTGVPPWYGHALLAVAVLPVAAFRNGWVRNCWDCCISRSRSSCCCSRSVRAT